ncbi:MAG TPA: hypothetical protein VFA09_07715 [Ktedonobacteraceae bacterium]|jgi:hypothetical protein|nr:hypothetical protein [Ktedonobacteraceae bacterium]
MQLVRKTGFVLDESALCTRRPGTRNHRGEAVRDMGESSTAGAEIVEERIMPVK